MHLIFKAAAAALFGLALSGCETTSGETTGSISSGKIKGSELSFGYASRPYADLISSHAKSQGVPESLAHAVISVESNYRANARGSAGEVGLMQIKPATARMMGYRGSAKGLYNPETNIKYGMLYLAKAHQLGGGTTCGTILKYNAGHGAKRMNPVSQRYCGKVTKLMK
ncbi:MAG: lytic transglycosylase domain-containing protein [Hoeflea sp.]|nr:lytic transglycosylase domain-containing protein [Hoeflea sp.]